MERRKEKKRMQRVPACLSGGRLPGRVMSHPGLPGTVLVFALKVMILGNPSVLCELGSWVAYFQVNLVDEYCGPLWVQWASLPWRGPQGCLFGGGQVCHEWAECRLDASSHATRARPVTSWQLRCSPQRTRFQSGQVALCLEAPRVE